MLFESHLIIMSVAQNVDEHEEKLLNMILGEILVPESR